MTRPMTPRARLVPLRSTAATRRAAMGLVRAARKAGITAEMTRHQRAHHQHLDDRGGLDAARSTPPDPVRFLSTGHHRHQQPRNSPMPTSIPMALATRPTTTASIITARRTWRLARPTARSRANSRMRWATTMAKVL